MSILLWIIAAFVAVAFFASMAARIQRGRD